MASGDVNEWEGFLKRRRKLMSRKYLLADGEWVVRHEASPTAAGLEESQAPRSTSLDPHPRGQPRLPFTSLQFANGRLIKIFKKI